jgi:hypothetical protein
MCVFFLLDLNSEHSAESCNKTKSTLVLIQPPNAIAELCQFSHRFILSAYPLSYNSSLFTVLTVISVLKNMKDIWKRGGIIVILLENTKKHNLKPKMEGINCIYPCSAIFIQTLIFYSAYMNPGKNSFCSSAKIKLSCHHHHHHHHLYHKTYI